MIATRALAIGLAAASAITACATHGARPAWEHRRSKMDQITALWMQIRDWRHDAGLRVDPSAEAMLEMRTRPLPDARQSCPDGHQVTTTCEDVCSLADAICDNAEAICGIADELGKDDHQAQEKCTSAKASCREAKQRCCTKCSEAPPQ